MSRASATILDGELLASRLRAEIAADVRALRSRGIIPLLATVTLGSDSATDAYMQRKHRDCVEVGIASRDIRLGDGTGEAGLLGQIDALTNDPQVVGYSVQFPLPPGMHEDVVIRRCDPAKDADGKHPLNLGLLLWGAAAPRPCTAAGTLALLQAHGVQLAGRRVLLIGRGFFTGRPLMFMLAAAGIDATVTVAHRGTQNLPALCRESDVIISAAGVPALVTAAMVRAGAAVLGLGISYIEGQMLSDIAEDVASVAAYVTPQHGSLGALTRAMLLRNVVTMAGSGCE